jgi:hypothetical protein
MKTRKLIAKYLSRIPFIYNAIKDNADLSELKEKQAAAVFKKNLFGLILIGISYIICWPVIIFLGFLSIEHDRPLLILIGGPIVYAVAHFIFLIGLYIVGAHYAMIFLRWIARKSVEIFINRNDFLSAAEKTNE